jgi:hypothetical protein
MGIRTLMGVYLTESEKEDFMTDSLKDFADEIDREIDGEE